MPADAEGRKDRVMAVVKVAGRVEAEGDTEVHIQDLLLVNQTGWIGKFGLLYGIP